MNGRTAGSIRVFATVAVLAVEAAAANLNLSVVTEDGDRRAVASCGASVRYQVTGVLGDAQNRGLAGFSMALTWSGGSLTAADPPQSGPLLNFARPYGVTGAHGFGGIEVDGCLARVGGAQNTLNGVTPPFPIGPVATGVAHAEVVLVTGSLTVLSMPGTYTLSVSNVSATVIRQGETGTPIWATEPAGIGTLTDLTIEVVPSDPPAFASNNGPVCGGDDVMLLGEPHGMVGYSWTGPNGFTSSDQNPIVSPALRGTYVLTATEAGGCVTVDRTVVEVLPALCEPWVDCNTNSSHDACDIALGSSDDCNWNRKPDECDLAAATSLDCNATGTPDECDAVGGGDFNGDDEVGLGDYRAFHTCANGPQTAINAPAPECADAYLRAFDVDNDQDVDLRDFSALQLTFRR